MSDGPPRPLSVWPGRSRSPPVPYHWPLMFSKIQIVDSCSAPPMSTPGHCPRFVWSMWNVPGEKTSDVIVEVTGQLRTSGLPPTMMTEPTPNPAGAGPLGPGTGDGGGATGCAGVANAKTLENGPVVVGSNARTCQ